MSLYSLSGKFTQYIGTAATVTLAANEIVLRIYAHSTAGGTIAIFGGTALPVIANQAPVDLRYNHLCLRPGATKTIVFTTTDAYLVETITPGSG